MKKEDLEKFLNYLDYLLSIKIGKVVMIKRISRWARRRNMKISKNSWKRLGDMIDNRLKFREEELFKAFLKIIEEKYGIKAKKEHYEYLRSLGVTSETLEDPKILKLVIDYFAEGRALDDTVKKLYGREPHGEKR